MRFEVVKADITNMAVDAIVLPANEWLKEGSGTSQAIFEKAGRKELTKACQQIGHCSVGSVAITKGFQLKAKHIIHAVVPKWIDGMHNEYEYLTVAYATALYVADHNGYRSIAFPLLASGNNGFDKDLAYQIAVNCFELFEGKSLQQIYLVVYGENTAKYIRSLGTPVVDYYAMKTSRKPLLKEETVESLKEAFDVTVNSFSDWIKSEKTQEKILAFSAQVGKQVGKWAFNELKRKF